MGNKRQDGARQMNPTSFFFFHLPPNVQSLFEAHIKQTCLLCLFKTHHEVGASAMVYHILLLCRYFVCCLFINPFLPQLDQHKKKICAFTFTQTQPFIRSELKKTGAGNGSRKDVQDGNLVRNQQRPYRWELRWYLSFHL